MGLGDFEFHLKAASPATRGGNQAVVTGKHFDVPKAALANFCHGIQDCTRVGFKGLRFGGSRLRALEP